MSTALAQPSMPAIQRVDLPVVNGTSVTFSLRAPSAAEVLVSGDFIPGTDGFGLGGELPLEKGPDGTWTLTVNNLAPEFYFYYYLVDGVRTLDPGNIAVVHNFREYLNTFMIPGEDSRLYELAPEKKGTLAQVWYPSSVIGCERRAQVYLPYGYDGSARYPVLYLQHGGGDDEEDWPQMGRACQILDNLIAQGKVVPMIVVMPNSWDNQIASMNIAQPLSDIPTIFSPEARSSDAFRSGGKWVDDLVGCLIPYMDSHFSTIPDRHHRALAGLSMGGLYTLYAAQHHADLFSWWGVLGMGIENPADVDMILDPVKEAGYSLMWIGAGKSDMAYRNAEILMEGMDRKEMPYTYYDPQDGHNWRSWRRDLRELLPLLFR